MLENITRNAWSGIQYDLQQLPLSVLLSCIHFLLCSAPWRMSQAMVAVKTQRLLLEANIKQVLHLAPL